MPWAEVVLILLLTFIMLTIVYTPSRVRGASMQPNIYDRDIVMVSNDKIRRNCIVTAQPRNLRIIKRVVGMPGDELEFKLNANDSRFVDFYRNGELVEENYIKDPMLADKFRGYSEVEIGEKIVLEADFYYLMGDNRNNSEDSREVGPVHKSKITGVVGAIYRENSFMAEVITMLYRPAE